MKLVARKTCLLVAGLLVSGLSLGQDEAPMMIKGNSGIALDDAVDLSMCRPAGVAVGGYDLVSYRSTDGPQKGKQHYAAEHEGLMYLFFSQENLELFLQSPAQFLPAFSGFCAITLALGRVTCPEYTNYKIENDQLLLFEVTGFTNGRTLWDSDAKRFRQQADANFEQLVDLN